MLERFELFYEELPSAAKFKEYIMRAKKKPIPRAIMWSKLPRKRG